MSQHISGSNSGSTYTSGLTTGTTTDASGLEPWGKLDDVRFVGSAPPRRGIPRHLALVWLEREDEPIPAPWTDCVMRRFFDHATASYGVIIESSDIPWETPPGKHLFQFSSWAALDVEVRRVTLQRAADVLPNPKWSEEADKDPLRQYQQLQNQQLQNQAATLFNHQQVYSSSPLMMSAPDVGWVETVIGWFNK